MIPGAGPWVRAPMDWQMTNKDFAGGDDALPEDGAMPLYARAYASSMTADELVLRWEIHLAHAMSLEQAPDRTYPDNGLNGRQPAEECYKSKYGQSE